ncbi:AAA family ATPase [Peribacillus sp. R9-11]|uniref:ATP-dependent nuclease n=1 Tax=Peribacillus sp. R9-11 TaxID=3073271 RepID=UPI0028685402|nr:AAA family ATPase [Peribacillus sp. R9-11]WMX58623.1 AAA family ATPase [Peribacillus sp. R9-11]
MQFKITGYFRDLNKLIQSTPMVILTTDNWNDYGFKTLFHMKYFDENGKQHEIGDIKILHQSDYDSRSLLPTTTFEKLSKEFCSLGQDLDFYEMVMKLGKDRGIEILKSLNDVVISSETYEKFKDLEGFNSSLIRYSEAEKALKEAHKLFEEKVVEENNYKFKFSYKLKAAEEPHIISFDFSKDNALPNRINAIIGKNGTGKTQILAKIGAVASGYEKGKGRNFIPERPSFSKIIAISYSVFDEFDRPKGDGQTFSYKYCGIRDKENRVISNGEIRRNIVDNLKVIKNNKKLEIWHSAMKEILESQHSKALDALINDELVTLSSGQSLIILTLTELIATIEQESLLLFDEPENHLHPNALSNLVRVLNNLLEQFNSYAIISTHSPIVVQEIPSKYINVIERYGSVPFVRPMHIESFGENLSNITNEVFDVGSTESNYKMILQKLSAEMSYDEILELFDLELSYNAVIYLNKLFRDKDKK